MSLLKVFVASLVALGLVFGLVLPALAAPDEVPPWTEDFQVRIVKGTVTYVDEENQAYFKVQSGENEIGIRVDENTKYFLLDVPERIMALARNLKQFRNQEEPVAIGESGVGLQLQERVRLKALAQERVRLRVHRPIALTEAVPPPEVVEPELRRPFGAEAGFSDIEVGDRVVVWLANGDSLAKWVLIIKPTTRARVSGTITDVSSATITIAPDDGDAVTLRYNQDTVFVLNGFTSVEERQLARAVYDSEHMMAKKVLVYLPG